MRWRHADESLNGVDLNHDDHHDHATHHDESADRRRHRHMHRVAE
jgi:hypothetical protein